ncbi:peptide chain release factor-like protein [Polyangium aurulentum]|uniref:peptide chain release factor-like protein n=1 Tax=Polyangium aurulentum TaxID=2567896 RepID=UPI0010AE6F0F|nr:peptide chain release factor-like protein [Polyangium aurulentum]UQA56733.1 peptide chain release factor-like protein [Polyangium aurulentum]
MSAWIVQITAGRGPVEVRRFVALLAARIEALVTERGLLAREIVVHGDEEAPWSVEIEAIGDAPTMLADEIGTHALVARSPSRGRAARKRWFAAVAIHPAREDATAAVRGAEIELRDLEISAARAGGPGGQNVNKTASAVRVRHLPTGITVRVTEERSQRANLARAIARIGARLAADAEAAAARSISARRSAHDRLERGAPVRTYGLSPRGELTHR